jgi:hypothetical protein
MRAVANYIVAISVCHLAGWSEEIHAADAKTEPKAESSVEVIYDAEEPVEQEPTSFFPRIEEIFENPALASGLASGAEALNRSIDSLMDAVFYSLLDNELRYKLTDANIFSAKIQRDVYDTTAGQYIVVDRFSLGPEHSRLLRTLHNIAVTLGANGKVDVLQIYLRSDGMRLDEQQKMNFLERWVANWFGLVPLLAAVLPPSFNPNEMFDPIKLVQTPFVFPLDGDSFKKMPIGSIRSYTVSGGVQFGISFNDVLDQRTRETLKRLEGLTQSLPYSVFVEGQHRINVMRRDEHTAWVGVTNIKSLGHRFGATIGNTLALLKGAFGIKTKNVHWSWQGFAAPIFPIDAQLEQVVADQFDQLFQFDIRNFHALQAYESAVTGDFTVARQKQLLESEQRIPTGVKFEFTKKELRRSIETRVGPNLTLVRYNRRHNRSRSESEIVDPAGKFDVLDARQDIRDEGWDALVGGEEIDFQNNAELRVRKVVEAESNGSKRYFYRFDPGAKPYSMTLSMKVQDRYVDTREYNNYIQELADFTQIDMRSMPKFADVDHDRAANARRRAYFSVVDSDVTNVKVPSSYLGRFGAQAAIHLDSDHLQMILDKSADELWSAFADVFGRPGDWRNAEVRSSLGTQFEWFAPFFFYPLRLGNIRVPWIDAISEASLWAEAMEGLKAAQTPEEYRFQFFQLFNTDYPELMAKWMLSLLDTDDVPRSISFFAEPKGGADQSVKKRFRDINNKILRAGGQAPEPSRYSRAQAKLAEFYLDKPRETGERPQIRKVTIFGRDSGDKGADKSLLDRVNPMKFFSETGQALRRIVARMVVKNTHQSGILKVFVRIEQGGRFDLGRLKLTEGVVDATVAETLKAPGPDLQVIEVDLTSEILRNFIYDQALELGSSFRVSLAVSADGSLWSQEKNVEFLFDGGLLRPVDPE